VSYAKAAFRLIFMSIGMPIGVIVVSGMCWGVWWAIAWSGDQLFDWKLHVGFWDFTYWVVVFYLVTAAITSFSMQYFGGQSAADADKKRGEDLLTYAGILAVTFPMLLVVGTLDSRPDTYLSPEHMNVRDIAIIAADELAKGLFVDVFEYFRIQTIDFHYNIGVNIETAAGFVHRVLAGPFAVFAVYIAGKEGG
jgi:hypothetical protein